MKKLGPLPKPTMALAHDVRHLVVCAYSRCRQLGDERVMVTVRSTDFQSKSSGEACYHGRCYVRKFGLAALLKLPKRKTGRLMWSDVGIVTMKALLKRRGIK